MYVRALIAACGFALFISATGSAIACPHGQYRGAFGFCYPEIPKPKPPRIGGSVGSAWEHIKSDWGPAVNKGFNHATKQVWDFARNVFWSSCTEAGYQYGSHQPCYQGAKGAATTSPVRHPDDPTSPEEPLGPGVSGPKLTAIVGNDTLFSRHIEVFDAIGGQWTYHFDLGPHGKMLVDLKTEDTGHAQAILRWDHDPRNDTRYSWISPGETIGN